MVKKKEEKEVGGVNFTVTSEDSMPSASIPSSSNDVWIPMTQKEVEKYSDECRICKFRPYKSSTGLRLIKREVEDADGNKKVCVGEGVLN